MINTERIHWLYTYDSGIGLEGCKKGKREWKNFKIEEQLSLQLEITT